MRRSFTRKRIYPYLFSVNGQLISCSTSHRFWGRLLTQTSPELMWITLNNRWRQFAICSGFKQEILGECQYTLCCNFTGSLFIGFLWYSLSVISNTCRTNLDTIQMIQATLHDMPRSTMKRINDRGYCNRLRFCNQDEYFHWDNARTKQTFTWNPTHRLTSLPAERSHTTFSATAFTHHAPAARPIIPPWCVSRPPVKGTIPGFEKMSDFRSSTLKQLSLLLLYEKYGNCTHVFTDGSTISTNWGCVTSRHYNVRSAFSYM